jgi:hypothetical protein
MAHRSLVLHLALSVHFVRRRPPTFEVFGEAGRHTRFAVGGAGLLFNFAVEIKGVFEIA